MYFIKYKPAGCLTHAGTGKTVIAIFDYRNFRKKHLGEACRLLFAAHCEEILTQSRDTFQGVLRDLNFDELFVGNYVIARANMVLVRMLSAAGICKKEWKEQMYKTVLQ